MIGASPQDERPAVTGQHIDSVWVEVAAVTASGSRFGDQKSGPFAVNEYRSWPTLEAVVAL